MSEVGSEPKDPTQVARELAAALNAADCEYALGGAIALGFWAEPRGTLDVDVTLFLPVTQPSSCVRLLQNIGCKVQSNQAIQSLTEHGFCQVEFGGRRVDIFLPLTPFYEQARLRRRQVILGGQPIMIWDAETLCVFKMMFFRRKDLADVEQVLRMQSADFDSQWVREQLVEMYGKLDPRISQWDELVSETV